MSICNNHFDLWLGDQVAKQRIQMINLNKAQLGSPINNILVYVIYASIILMEITRNVYIRKSLVSG